MSTIYFEVCEAAALNILCQELCDVSCLDALVLSKHDEDHGVLHFDSVSLS